MYLFPFLHQATTLLRLQSSRLCCISSLFYIKPQPSFGLSVSGGVVSLPFSTSSHNDFRGLHHAVQLYLFPFLHQATTLIFRLLLPYGCISSLFYIKPQLRDLNADNIESCISSLFYIKPQPFAVVIIITLRCISSLFYIKPQLRAGTRKKQQCCISSLFYIKPQPRNLPEIFYLGCISSLFYIKPQRCNVDNNTMSGCISSLFYIKPQLWSWR